MDGAAGMLEGRTSKGVYFAFNWAERNTDNLNRGRIRTLRTTTSRHKRSIS